MVVGVHALLKKGEGEMEGEREKEREGEREKEREGEREKEREDRHKGPKDIAFFGFFC